MSCISEVELTLESIIEKEIKHNLLLLLEADIVCATAFIFLLEDLFTNNQVFHGHSVKRCATL